MTVSCYWFAIHPDIKRPVGGVKQIHRLAEAIAKSGRRSVLIQDSDDFHPSWFDSSVETISKTKWKQLSGLDPHSNVVVLPETFVSVLPSYAKTLPSIIFNQNAAYTFGVNSSSSFPDPRTVLAYYTSSYLSHVWCVSSHDYRFLTDAIRLPPNKVSLITNGLEDGLFKPGKYKKRQIAYMPRKNSRDCQIVIQLLRLQPWLQGWKLQPISNCTQKQVSGILQDSILFLSFGHPEGFGLPVAEALACGCGVVGYSGLGGRELFSLAKQYQVAKEIGFGDWLGFITATHQFLIAFNSRPSWLRSKLLSCSDSIRLKYSQLAMQQSVCKALDSVESQLPRSLG